MRLNMSRRIIIFFGRVRVIDPPYISAIPVAPGTLTSADGTRKHGQRKKEGLKEATAPIGRGREQKGGNRRVTRKVVQLSGERDSLFAASIKVRVAAPKSLSGKRHGIRHGSRRI